jgi:hypothetical protein
LVLAQTGGEFSRSGSLVSVPLWQTGWQIGNDMSGSKGLVAKMSEPLAAMSRSVSIPAFSGWIARISTLFRPSAFSPFSTEVLVRGYRIIRRREFL